MKQYAPLLFLTLQGFITSTHNLNESEHKLLALAINRKGLFVKRQPIMRLHLSLYDTMSTWRNGSKHLPIPAKTLMELIIKSMSPDTAVWTTQELDSVVLISNCDGYLNVQEEVLKLHLHSKELTKYYTKSIRRFNNTEVSERNVVYFSRPVFDNSRNYALIESDNGYLLSGGGAITLYKKEGVWREVGIVKRWAH